MAVELYLKRVNTNKHDSRPWGHNTILKHIERLRKMIRGLFGMNGLIKTRLSVQSELRADLLHQREV